MAAKQFQFDGIIRCASAEAAFLVGGRNLYLHCGIEVIVAKEGEIT